MRLRSMRALLGATPTRALLGAMVALGTAHAVRAAEFYHLKREVPVASEGAAFDYVVYRAGKLFVGHRPDGLQVFDTGHDFTMTTIADSKGSNGATLMDDLGLGVSHNTDGTLTVFNIDDLKVVNKIKVGEEIDSSRYDPVTKRLAVFGIPPDGGKGGMVVVFQAPSMERVGTITSPSAKLEHSVADGTGSIYVSAQDLDAIVRLDMRDMKQTASMPVPCKQPTGIDRDAAHKRLVIGCRGAITEPMVVVLDETSGATVFKGPIGGGNDGIVYDAKRGRIIATNGVGANLVVYRENGADGYALDQVVQTRPMAKAMALDPATGDVYTIAAEGVFDTSRKNLAYVTPFYPNMFTRNSFRVLQYGF